MWTSEPNIYSIDVSNEKQVGPLWGWGRVQ